MICSTCSRKNPANALFCNTCGNKLETVCPSCQTENPPGSNFCNSCGTSLTGSQASDLTPLEEKIDKIQRYLPQGLTEKILSQKDRIEGERKVVTVLFCDLVGYTKMAAGLDPEETYTLMDQVLEILIHSVHDYGGTVNQLLGDGLYALFGAPIALEDGPQRAIRAGMDMHKALTRFSDKIAREKKIAPLKLRIGINTGAVVVGTIGNSLRVDFTAIGDTVNLASRMEGLAEPGTIYVTAETFKLTEHFFRFEALGEKTVKGFETPIAVYQVIERSNSRTRFDVSAERGLTPLVGRDREIEVLLDGFRAIKSGRGQVFSIIADAGAGKSRLLYEFRKAVANEDAAILEGKCLSYAPNIAYLPIIDIIKSGFLISENDSGDQVKQKLIEGLKLLDIETALSLPYLLDLLDIRDTDVDLSGISPELKKEKISELVKTIAINRSELECLILIVEDLHWMDKTSEEVLTDLLAGISGSRVLMILAYRPEYHESWSRKSNQNRLNLNHLTNRESAAMLSAILKVEDLAHEFENMVLDRTGGIPFYIEELTKSLINLNVIELKGGRYCLSTNIDNVYIPSSIQDVIMSRVDTISEAARDFVQTGAVIGREFQLKLVSEISGLPEKALLVYLAELTESDIIYQRGVIPDITCIFRHALTRDVIYDSILSKRKKKLHEEIGNTIEKLYADHMDQHLEILTDHFFLGEDFGKSADYARLAGKKARKSGLFVDALNHLKKSILCLESLPDTEDNQKRIIDARTRLSDYCMGINYHVEAKNAVDPIIGLAEKLNYKKRLPKIYLAIGSYQQQVKEDIEGGRKSLLETVRLAEELQDGYALWTASFYLGSLYAVGEANMDKGLGFFTKCLDISTMINDKGMIAWLKSNIALFVTYNQGYIKKAFEQTDQTLQDAIADNLTDIRSKGVAYYCHGHCCHGMGYFKEAEENLINAINLCQSSSLFNFQSYAIYCLGVVYIDTGRYELARRCFQDAQQLLKSHEYAPSVRLCCKTAEVLVELYLGNDRFDLRKVMHHHHEMKIAVFQRFASRHIGEMFLKIKNQQIHDPDDWFKQAIEIDRHYKLKWFLGHDYAQYAKFLKSRNSLPQAREKMNIAIDILKECGADGWVERYEKELAEI